MRCLCGLRCPWIALLAVAAGASPVAADPDITLESTEWGIGGRLVERGFNPVTLEVRNDGDEVFDGTVRLQPVATIRSRLGQVVHQADLYLMPGQTRRLTFAVVANPQRLEWELVWSERPGTSRPLDLLGRTMPGSVQLASDGRGGGALPVIAAAALPGKVTVMEAIDAIVIADDLTLQPSQETALVDYVRAGGTIVLAPKTTGDWPELTGGLSDLSPAAGTRTLGRGVVAVVDDPVGDLTPELVRERIEGVRSTKAEDAENGRAGNLVDADTKYAFDADAEVLRLLSQIVQPRSFAVLYVPLSFAYVAGLVWVGRRSRRQRWTPRRYFATLAALVIAATLTLALASPLRTNSTAFTTTLVAISPLGPSSSQSSQQPDGPQRAYVRQWAVTRSSHLGSREYAAVADAQVMSAEGSGLLATIREGAAQSMLVRQNPLTSASLRARGIVDGVQPPQMKVELTRLSGSAIRATVTFPDLTAAEVRERFPAALVMAGSQYVAVAPNPKATIRGNRLVDIPHTSTGRLTPVDNVVRGYTWNLGPLSRNVIGGPGTLRSWMQSVSGTIVGNVLADSVETKFVKARFDLLAAVPFVDRRTSGTLTRDQMSLPPGEVRVLLLDRIVPEADLLSNGRRGPQRGATIWNIRHTGTAIDEQ